MRVALPLIALLFASAASADAPQTALPHPELPRLAQGPAKSPQLAPDGERVCRDRIEQVRAASGLPKLDRENATDEQPLLIAAVDKRINGCSVMVMRNDLSDIRPLPAVPEGAAKLRRLR